jgi:hypothetical protein
MKDVLDVYAEPCDPARPVVCVDEHPYAFTAPARDPIPAVPGRVAKDDYEDERCGSGTVFVALQPLAGWRTLQVEERRTRSEFASFLKALVDEHFPTATTIRLVCDNLNTHAAAALYAAYPATEARRIARKLEWHFTPTHGSWLNMAEIELSILSRQCLKRRLQDRETVQQQVDAWVAQHNAAGSTVHWHFTVADALDRFRKRYPTPTPPAATPLPVRADAEPQRPHPHAA